MIVLILAIVGLCLGSFVNALCWRLRQQELKAKSLKLKANDRKLLARDSQPSAGDLSILRGRSMCPNCKHELAAKDLVPVFSWLTLRGRCRYCRAPISWQYPVVELACAAIFVFSYLFWPVALATGQWLLLASYLLAAVGLLALAVYDFKWMELPNRILYPTFFVAAAGRLGYILLYSGNMAHQLIMWALSVAVASGLFFILFIASQGRWIGYGDVRLGLVTGTVLAAPSKSFLMIFLASILGTIFVIPGLLAGKKTATSRLPFGPFLILATFIVVLFGDSFINWYKIHLL